MFGFFSLGHERVQLSTYRLSAYYYYLEYYCITLYYILLDFY